MAAPVGFTRPDWLPPEPYFRWDDYGPRAREVWYTFCQPSPPDFISTVHQAALNGDADALEHMRQFYLHLATDRLTG